MLKDKFIILNIRIPVVIDKGKVFYSLRFGKFLNMYRQRNIINF